METTDMAKENIVSLNRSSPKVLLFFLRASSSKELITHSFPSPIQEATITHLTVSTDAAPVDAVQLVVLALDTESMVEAALAVVDALLGELLEQLGHHVLDVHGASLKQYRKQRERY
uniref:ACT domain-containing protein n=1 Tax=Steinernema glaseri TaxID=37863 RepID=A0A1I8A1W8_9BILA